MKPKDERTLVEKIDDLIADDELSLQEIADKLFVPYPQVRSRYLTICHKLGVRPDGD